MNTSADLESLTDGYGGTNTGSDEKCTRPSRPYRKSHSPNPFRLKPADALSRPDNDRALSSKRAGGIGAETARRPVVIRRACSAQGDGRPVGTHTRLPCRNLLSLVLGCFRPSSHRGCCFFTLFFSVFCLLPTYGVKVMNEVSSVELRALCEVLEQARGRFEMLGMMNTRTDPVERATQSFEYEKAKTEYWIASDAVHSFQLRMLKALA